MQEAVADIDGIKKLEEFWQVWIMQDHKELMCYCSKKFSATIETSLMSKASIELTPN